MIFVCATITWNTAAGAPAALTAMADARRSVRGPTPQALSGPGLQLSYAGSTPLTASAGQVSAYLFRPASEALASDEQTLARVLTAYNAGRVVCDELAGAFVLLLVDAGQHRVSLATDRFAICPIYYFASDETLSFATDLDALRAAPGFKRGYDSQSLYNYVFFHCIPSPRTIYRNVSKLGPAQYLNWSPGRCQTALHWQPGFTSVTAEAELLDAQLRDALAAAVADRGRAGCAAFLSGGLDSSSVAGLLKGARGTAKAFTIGFDAEGYDESEYARIAAQHFALEHHLHYVTPADVYESLPQIAAYYAQPFGNSSVIPTFHCAQQAREHGVTLMLAGDGGDELFAGNQRYIDQQVFERYFKLPALLRAMLEGGYRALPVLRALPVAGKGARYIAKANMGLPDRLQAYNFLHQFDPLKVFNGDWLATVERDEPWHMWRQRFAESAATDDLQRMLYLDWKFTLADNDLVKVGSMCDLAGIEVCYPMLDKRVVDLAQGVAPTTLLLNGELRGYYKRAFSTVLPAQIINKQKHGFGLPFGVWLREDARLQELARGALGALAQRDIFQRSFLAEVERLFWSDSASSYYGELVWVLSMLELWFAAHDE
jgi:asparagine synthase (glutamine-hydrolysing)